MVVATVRVVGRPACRHRPPLPVNVVGRPTGRTVGVPAPGRPPSRRVASPFSHLPLDVVAPVGGDALAPPPTPVGLRPSVAGPQARSTVEGPRVVVAQARPPPTAGGLLRPHPCAVAALDPDAVAVDTVAPPRLARPVDGAARPIGTRRRAATRPVGP